MVRNRKSKGFSLLELLAVITIMGIIASVVISRVSHHALDAKKKCCQQYRGDINSAIENYRFDIGSSPATVDLLQTGGYYPEAVPKCPITGLDYQIDATSGRVLDHNH